MRAAQLLVESTLPLTMRRSGRRYTSKELGSILSDVAVNDPESYSDLLSKLARYGRETSYWQGETIGLSDLRPVFDRGPLLQMMRDELTQLDSDAPDFEKQRENVWRKYNSEISKLTMAHGLAQGNSIAASVASGARGKEDQFKMMVSGPGLFADAQGKTVPMFISHSFAEGLRPAEYLASTYGARGSIVNIKTATAKGGDLLKQAAAVAMRQMVTEEDCGTANGIDLPADDDSLRGRVLALDLAGHKAGEVIDRSVLKDIRKAGVETVVARSPVSCQSKNGVCSHCVGKFHDQKFPKVGQHVGVAAAQALFEPVVQGSLGSKHSGGAVQAGGKAVYGGFDIINRIMQSPDNFPERSIVSETQGIVNKIEEAPQGGHFVWVNQERHYVPVSRELAVKQGQEVEPGEPLSEGVVDARDIVRLRGLGSGRRQYADRLWQAMGDSGQKADRRNVEILARGAINHIRVDDDENLPGVLPDDLVDYNRLQMDYSPPATAKMRRPSEAVGQYLQVPVMHYSIGTKLTRRQAERLEKAGYSNVMTDSSEPSFHPEMQRLRTATQQDPDWLARQHASYLKSNMDVAATRGQDTNVRSNTHFAPRLAFGKDFGKTVGQTGAF